MQMREIALKWINFNQFQHSNFREREREIEREYVQKLDSFSQKKYDSNSLFTCIRTSNLRCTKNMSGNS